MGKPRQTFKFRDMVYQSKLTDIFAIDCIVPSLECDAMIPDRTVSVYRFMQISIAVVAI